MANLQDKRGTAAALAAANPTPLEGEVLYETDTRKFKVGDGSAAYTSLSYVGLSSIATANGVSAAVALGVATITLGAITPSSVTVSGVITCSAGSAALPSVTTTGDTNTGIWFPAADTVGLSTGGVERVRVDSSGNVGLGVRIGYNVTPSAYWLTTQANAGLTICHAAKGGTLDLYQPKRNLSAYTFNDSATNYGIMRIRIPAAGSTGFRFTIKHTGLIAPAYSRLWEINCADYYSGNGIFGTNSISVAGAPEFSRVRLMQNTSETIWNSVATRYLILGQIIAGIGTVSNTAASATVTGSGTKFTHLFKVGDGILINSLWNYITAIASDTSLTVSAAITLANTAVVYSRGDTFAASQMTIDVDQLHVPTAVQMNTAFEIDFADTEATLSLVAGIGRDITINNTNAQHGFVGIGTQSPSNLLHVAQQKLGRGTVSNSASGTVLSGVNTTFLDTFKIGDSVTVPHIGGSTGTPQTVVISAIASNTSMTVAAITSANSGVNYSLAGGTLFSVAGNGTITTSSSGNTLSGTNTGDQTPTSLGLVIGTNVQAYDAGLLSIAAATTAADRFLYTTALDVYAVATITAFGRSLVDDADASTARTTLGLGTISTQASSAVAITGGAINGATIGATTATTGAFTTLSAQGSVSGFVAFQAPATPTSHTYTLPTVTGTAGQVLTTNGSSVLSWTAPTVRATITATASQTAFTVSGGYTVGGIDVYLNGIKQVNGDDFTATNGTSITLTQGADAGDILDYVAFGFAVTTGALVKSGDTMTGSLTMTAGTTFTMSGFTETTVVIGNSSTTQTISITNGTQVTCTLTGNCTFTMPTATAGKSFTLLLKTGAGAFTATFTGVKWPGATPTITATASRLDIIRFLADGVNWYGSITQNYTP
jgi:Major tropism determinant N-terminal domain